MKKKKKNAKKKKVKKRSHKKKIQRQKKGKQEDNQNADLMKLPAHQFMKKLHRLPHNSKS